MFRRYFVFVLCLAACGGSSAPPAPDNGVNDVLQACQLRSSWEHASSTPCNTCIGLATTPRCACTDREEAGRCSDQAAAVRNEATCSNVDECVGKCARTDCACVDGCYAGKAACRNLASAEDGCVAHVCDASCR